MLTVVFCFLFIFFAFSGRIKKAEAEKLEVLVGRRHPGGALPVGGLWSGHTSGKPILL